VVLGLFGLLAVIGLRSGRPQHRPVVRLVAAR